MALLRTFTVDNIDANSYSNWYKMKVEVHLNSQNIANNTSNITLKQFFATKTSSAGWYTISHTRLNRLSIGGGLCHKDGANMRDMPQIVLMFGAIWEWTGNVSHASDGQGKLMLGFLFQGIALHHTCLKKTGTSSDISL